MAADAVKRICPTVQELLAFDAVARHENITQAASDLCMSVSGVSKQISGLETFIGKALLKKLGRGVQLTTAGRDYWKKIAPGLRMIETATVEAQADDADYGLLVLASVPTFLTKCLISKLADFRRYFPNVTFVFKHHTDLDAAFPTDVDAMISLGLGNWPKIMADYIAGQEFVCICSPDRLKTSRSIKEPEDLLAHPLLHLQNAPLGWQKWGNDHGIKGKETHKGPRFTQYSAVIQAAVSGLGVGLVPRVLVNEDLQERHLIAFFSSCHKDHGHYLCFRTDSLERPVLTAFRSWLQEQWKTAAEL